MCSRRKEREHLEEWFPIFNQVVGVGFVVKQRLSEDSREVWQCEETSVAGAEWVKRRAAGQGPRANREGLDVEASGDMLRACAQSEEGGGGGWLWVGLCPLEKDVEVPTPGTWGCDLIWNQGFPDVISSVKTRTHCVRVVLIQ